MNVIVLDKSDPVIAEAVAGCEVGKPQSFTLTFTPVADDDTQLVANIDPASIAYTGEDEEEEEVMEEEAEPSEAPYRPGAASGSATSVAY